MTGLRAFGVSARHNHVISSVHKQSQWGSLQEVRSHYCCFFCPPVLCRACPEHPSAAFTHPLSCCFKSGTPASTCLTRVVLGLQRHLGVLRFLSLNDMVTWCRALWLHHLAMEIPIIVIQGFQCSSLPVFPAVCRSIDDHQRNLFVNESTGLVFSPYIPFKIFYKYPALVHICKRVISLQSNV